MRTTLALARYEFLVLVRTPGYWLTALVLSALGITVFGLFLSDPTGPRLGIVDEAQNEAASAFITAAKDLDRVSVRVGRLDEQLDKLADGERWAVVALPEGFGDTGGLEGVTIYTTNTGEFTTLTGSGIIKQLLADTVGVGQTPGIQVQSEPVGGDDPLRFIDIVVPGQVGLSLMFGNLFAAGMIGWWRQQGILKRFAASPARPVHLLASQLIVFGALSIAQATILLSIGTLVFGVDIEGSVLTLAFVVLAGILAFLILWYTLTALVRSPIAANSLASLLGFVMMFAGGSYIPVNDPPLILRPIVAAAPLTYLNRALRDVVNRGEGLSSIWPELTVLAVWIVALFAVSMRAFRWTSES